MAFLLLTIIYLPEGFDVVEATSLMPPVALVKIHMVLCSGKANTLQRKTALLPSLMTNWLLGGTRILGSPTFRCTCTRGGRKGEGREGEGRERVGSEWWRERGIRGRILHVISPYYYGSSATSNLIMALACTWDEHGLYIQLRMYTTVTYSKLPYQTQ